MSQQSLAEAVGITFQQVQKYERGTNRISFSRLVQIADTLRSRLSDLSEGLDQNASAQELDHLNQLIAKDGALAMLEAFVAIPSPALRKALLIHARALVEVKDLAEP